MKKKLLVSHGNKLHKFGSKCSFCEKVTNMKQKKFIGRLLVKWFKEAEDEWTHVAIGYDPNEKKINNYINGVKTNS